ncbi:hypothetical protein T310_0202, partial [Rasamsonia emersonii CBS 393.64]
MSYARVRVRARAGLCWGLMKGRRSEWPTSYVNGLGFSADDVFLASSCDNMTRIWDDQKANIWDLQQQTCQGPVPDGNNDELIKQSRVSEEQLGVNVLAMLEVLSGFPESEETTSSNMSLNMAIRTCWWSTSWRV